MIFLSRWPLTYTYARGWRQGQAAVKRLALVSLAFCCYGGPRRSCNDRPQASDASSWHGRGCRRVSRDSRHPTPNELLGPFYPVRKPTDRDADLTHIAGRQGQATGQVLELSGRVLSTSGEPVPDARIEVWQANAAGRYRHPSDTTGLPLDPNFEGFCQIATDRTGGFKILTVKPGGYPGGRRGFRTPHIHFDITGRVERLVAQMYFPGEPTNATDQLLLANIDPPSVIAHELPPRADGVLRFGWDVVMRLG
ncbi:hypothetical protein [Novosphingobium sp. Gsoil 351]|uniref:dioxygenase family protein n=1 Tax=Novosphingobium sp. Gsoil 351 TaxID=2675225 RepID=UPI0021040A9A|nr:hypothetical protein [Novosphingobium sp. Gsoil 351]